MSAPPRKHHMLVTLGPTWESIDPIRFITNRATGTLGYFVAQEGLRRGHRVTCIAGPIALPPLPRARWIDVVGAEDMRRAVVSIFPKVDVLVMSAAVSDYRVKKLFHSKLKRGGKEISLLLEENRDILKEIARHRKHQILIGFALETERLLTHALRKLHEKNLDLLVANVLDRRNNPFGERQVNASLLWRNGRRRELKRVSKRKLASVLLDAIEELVLAKGSGDVAKW